MNKKTEIQDEADVFTTGEKLARDSAEGWFAFTKVGDRIGGVVRDMYERPGNGAFQAQRVFILEKKDGSLWNVGLKRTNYTLTRTDNLQIGDELGVTFEKEIPAKVKGHHPAKSLIFITKKNGDRIPGTQAKDMSPVANTEADAADKAFDDIDGDDIPFK